ncbi:MAG TPA: alpha/beta fold hydrolase [Mycobacteriales bacterium]|nr:alpha/beta fold hydrolase [Mycobacteriales bacterium]
MTTAVRTARLSDAPLPPVDRSIPPWPGSVRRTAGVDLFVRRTPGPAGGGEPALYVHGLGGASTNWTDLADLLSGRLHGEALDLPGFGRSGPLPRREYSVAGHARTVVALLEQSGRGPVHLFGNSLGGAVSVVVAARRPDLVRTLTLVSPALPSLRPRRGSDLTLPLLLVPGVARLVERRLATLPPPVRAQAVLDLCFADPSVVPPNRFAEAVEEVVRRQDVPWAMEAFTASLRALARSYALPGEGSLWRQAAAVRAPTLVVWGDHDRLVPVALASRTAATVPDARLLVLPGVGHVAQLEEPETVARAFLGLLEDTAGTAR